VKQRNVCVVYDSFMVWCSSSSVLYSIIDAFTLIKVVPHCMQIYKVWSKSNKTELIFDIYCPAQEYSPRNKYRHVIAHSSNVGSSKLQQCAVLEVTVDILEVPTPSISILFLEDGGSMSAQNFDNYLWNCSYPYPKEHNLNL